MTNTTPKPSPKHLVQSKAAIFNQPMNQTQSTPEHTSSAPKRMDHSKMSAFTEQKTEPEVVKVNEAPKQIDQSKFAMFNKKNEEPMVSTSSKQVKNMKPYLNLSFFEHNLIDPNLIINLTVLFIIILIRFKKNWKR